MYIGYVVGAGRREGDEDCAVTEVGGVRGDQLKLDGREQPREFGFGVGILEIFADPFEAAGGFPGVDEALDVRPFVVGTSTRTCVGPVPRFFERTEATSCANASVDSGFSALLISSSTDERPTPTPQT